MSASEPVSSKKNQGFLWVKLLALFLIAVSTYITLSVRSNLDSSSFLANSIVPAIPERFDFVRGIKGIESKAEASTESRVLELIDSKKQEKVSIFITVSDTVDLKTENYGSLMEDLKLFYSDKKSNGVLPIPEAIKNFLVAQFNPNKAADLSSIASLPNQAENNNKLDWLLFNIKGQSFYGLKLYSGRVSNTSPLGKELKLNGGSPQSVAVVTLVLSLSGNIAVDVLKELDTISYSLFYDKFA